MVEAIKQDIKHITALAGPLILTNLLYVAVATVDLIMLGMLSPVDLAAGGLAIAIFNQFRTMGTGLVTATGNLVSYAKGQGDDQQVAHLLKASLAWAAISGLVFAIIMLLTEPFLLLIGSDAELAAKAGDYIEIAALGMIPCLCFQSLRHFSVGLKAPGPLLGITAISVVLTVILNYGLIFGRFGLPELGFIGVAAATSIVLLVSFLLFLFFLLRHRQLSPYWSWSFWQYDKKAMHDVWRFGLPIAGTYGAEAGFFSVLSLLVATLGVSALAAHTVVNQVVYIVFMISAGISSAVSIYISEACAEKKYQHAYRIASSGLYLGASAMLTVAVVYWLAPQWVLWAFLTAEDFQQSGVLLTAGSLLFIASFLQFFDAGQNIGVGILRGIGDVKSPFKLSILGYWIIGLLCAWLFCIALDLGIQGVWYGLMVGLAFTALSQWIVFAKTLRKIEQTAISEVGAI